MLSYTDARQKVIEVAGSIPRPSPRVQVEIEQAFGRILAAVGALQTGYLMRVFENDYAKACSTVSLIYVIGMVIIWFAPETRGRPLPAGEPALPVGPSEDKRCAQLGDVEYR